MTTQSTLTPDQLTFNAYQERAQATAVYPFERWSPAAVSYCVLGLCGEAGEVAEKWKKVLRDHGGEVSDELRQKLLMEVSDVAWYLAQLCTELGVGFGTVAQLNLDKLRDRQQRGVLHGSGDAR